MDQNVTHIDILIAKVLAEEATSAEQQELEVWRAASPENQAYFAQSALIWSKMQAGHLRAEATVDTEAALAKVKQQINEKPAQPRLRISYRKYFYGLVGAVACLIVAVWLLKPASSQPIEIHATTTIKTDTLQDGTLATLNLGSVLILDKAFGRHERRVKLQGEAYFQVAPDAQKPYIVQTPDLEVRVLGTAFNVRYNPKKRETSVDVFEGKVMVSNAGLTRYLEKGQSIVYNPDDQAMVDGLTNENSIAYKTGRFAFDNAPLTAVLSEIGANYGVQFTIENPDLRNCPLTARLERQSLEALLDVLSETYGCIAKRDGDQIILIGGNCE